MEEYNLSPYHNQVDNLAGIPVTDVMIKHLCATKPWVRFMSVITFIIAGLMVLFGLIMILMPIAPGMDGFGIGPVLGIVYILMAGLYLAPAVFLHQFASAIGDLMQGGRDVALEAALGSQKSFWRFVGIMTLVLICVYALLIAIVMSVGVMGAMGGLKP